MILLTLLLGILLYIWSYRHIGGLVALLTTALYAFSPTILAHGRYVTTDIGATLGFFIGITTFVSFLENPSWRRFFIAGIAFGIAQLLKFSLILLIPMYGILILVWIWSRADISTASERIRLFFAYAAQTIGIGIVGVAVIWAAYAQVTARYPLDRNMRASCKSARGGWQHHVFSWHRFFKRIDLVFPAVIHGKRTTHVAYSRRVRACRFFTAYNKSPHLSTGY